MEIQKEVKLEKESHVYTDSRGVVYESVTRVIKCFTQEFEAEKISYHVAAKRDKESMAEAIKRGVSQVTVLNGYPKYNRGITREDVLLEWKENSREACDMGTLVHDGAEKFLLYGIKSGNEYDRYYEWLRKHVSWYKKIYPECVLYSKKYGIAGTSDLVCSRTGVGGGIVDIKDYKTNDISFNSIGEDFYTKQRKHYNRYMKDPLGHLEECDYNKYALQLSIYAYMLEEEFGYKIGNLEVVNMKWKSIVKPSTFPITYMKEEVKLILDYWKKNYKNR